MIKELQSLGLDMKVLDKDGGEIDLKQTFDDDDDMGLQPVDDEAFANVEVEGDMEGYAYEEPEVEESDYDDELDFALGSMLDDGDSDDTEKE